MAVPRALRILGLFSLDRPVLSIPTLVSALRASRATVYRDVRALVEVGLLERVDARGYALGTRIVELDRQIRLADPLVQATGDLAQELAAQSRGTVLLCRLTERTVLCILEVVGADGPPVSYQRGRAMPLYRGATSKILLAHVGTERLRELVASDRDELMEAGPPAAVDELHEALAPLRAKGHAVTRGEVDRGVIGMAVPLLDGPRILGSLSVVLSARTCTQAVERRTLASLARCARRIEARMETAREAVRPRRRIA
jgi:DNA-binding IclR family transcriptional regulator